MDSWKIKEECELMYKQISNSNERLKELRSMCKHENTFEGLYEYRIAATFPAIICSDCGSVIKSLLVIEPLNV